MLRHEEVHLLQNLPHYAGGVPGTRDEVDAAQIQSQARDNVCETQENTSYTNKRRESDPIRSREELTDVPADPAHQLPFPQLGDAKAAVPVSAAEQQAAVVGHHQHLGAELHPGRERPAQETLSPAGNQDRR